MDLASVTPLILTSNEEANIGRALEALTWAKRVLLVDSNSCDRTREIASSYKNVEIICREFDTHTSQWNFALDHAHSTWVLTLDADYVCPPTLPDELRGLDLQFEVYQANFRYCIQGRPLRGTLYPPRAVLFKSNCFRYRQDGHTQLLDVHVMSGKLLSVFLHDDRKSLNRWLTSQTQYADLEVEKLLDHSAHSLGWKDWIRTKIVLAAPLTFFYCLLYKRLLFDGWPGIFYSLQRTYAELLLSMKLLATRFEPPRIKPTEGVELD